ncbi:MAG TPA: DinB family protein [Bacteroidia bacterium]|nr:DinB family protein [Bacteroidia bacterium]
MTITKPLQKDCSEYAWSYINKVEQTNLLTALEVITKSTTDLFSHFHGEQLEYTYAPGKWNVKQILNHITDSERIFAYRILRFARKDSTELAGYDEDLFAKNDNTQNRTMDSLIDEYIHVRKSTILLLENFDDEILEIAGTANKNAFTIRTWAWMIAGHNQHHNEVVRLKYKK